MEATNTIKFDDYKELIEKAEYEFRDLEDFETYDDYYKYYEYQRLMSENTIEHFEKCVEHIKNGKLIKFAKEGIMKQIPMAAIEVVINNNKHVFKCPRCNNKAFSDCHYCRWCGQAITFKHTKLVWKEKKNNV